MNTHPVTHATPVCFTTWVTNASASPRMYINAHPLCHLSQATPDCFITWMSEESASVHVQMSIHPVAHSMHQLTASLPERLMQVHHPTYKWTPHPVPTIPCTSWQLHYERLMQLLHFTYVNEHPPCHPSHATPDSFIAWVTDVSASLFKHKWTPTQTGC